MQLGLLEIFFGPPWSMADRHSWAHFQKEHQLDFYMYGPKADGFLRKRWREEWPASWEAELTDLSRVYRANGIEFGVALSPFGLGSSLTGPAAEDLKKKVARLEQIGIDILGIFFDDMPVTEELAAVQIKVMELIQTRTRARLIFCPSFYTPDPILDKVFGQRPANYEADIGAGIAPGVEIVWTGPKVISEEIPAEHLRETAKLLRRKPFMCDNLFANDGPRHCKFLKLKPPLGRSREAFRETSGWSLNMMNQSELSKMTGLATKLQMKDGMDARPAYERAVRLLRPAPLADLILENEHRFVAVGLDQLAEEEKQSLFNSFGRFDDPAAREICRWLRGEYIVGSECLTD